MTPLKLFFHSNQTASLLAEEYHSQPFTAIGLLEEKFPQGQGAFKVVPDVICFQYNYSSLSLFKVTLFGSSFLI
jgi:hypothetical protein